MRSKTLAALMVLGTCTVLQTGLVLFGGPVLPPQAQEEKKTPAATKPPAPAEAQAAPLFSYDPGNRRDPFKDLFGGKELKEEKRVITGLADLSIDEIVIMGIVKSKGKMEAILSMTDGFPVTIHTGDKFADGYVLSIEDSQVVLRKTKDKGIPLMKPRDIIKEIIPEER